MDRQRQPGHNRAPDRRRQNACRYKSHILIEYSHFGSSSNSRSGSSVTFQAEEGVQDRGRVLGGGEWDIKALTVSTYDSAYIHADKLGNKFGLIIFDEVHHLPAAGYRNIAEMLASPFRMGLTATFEREDGLHEELNRLVGGKVFEKRVKELTGTHLSPYLPCEN